VEIYNEDIELAREMFPFPTIAFEKKERKKKKKTNKEKKQTNKQTRLDAGHFIRAVVDGTSRNITVWIPCAAIAVTAVMSGVKKKKV